MPFSPVHPARRFRVKTSNRAAAEPPARARLRSNKPTPSPNSSQVSYAFYPRIVLQTPISKGRPANLIWTKYTRQEIESITGQIRVLDEYIDFGAEKLRYWHSNFRPLVDNLWVRIRQLNLKHSGQDSQLKLCPSSNATNAADRSAALRGRVPLHTPVIASAAGAAYL